MSNERHSELNDIILQRTEKQDTRKKMLIVIGLLAIVAIVIIVIMGNMSDSDAPALPQPLKPTEQTASSATLEHVYPHKPVDVPAEMASSYAAVSSVRQNTITPTPIAQSEVRIVAKPNTDNRVSNAPLPQTVPAPSGMASAGEVYIQVGSFGRYAPNEKFIESVKSSGYAYTMHRIVLDGRILNKMLVGPFKDLSDAKVHLNDVQNHIEPDAYIYVVKP